MRYPADHKQSVRDRIVRAAAQALRRDGLVGVSIPALMKKAGLTHGGFYSHFKNRDDLVAEAVVEAGAQTGARVFADQPAIEGMLSSYLSKEHVDHPEVGCVLAALGTEAARQKPGVKRAFAQTARGFLQLVEHKTHPTTETGPVHDDTLALASKMIGAVILARLVHDDALAERILAVARQT